ncbi:PA2169 family four-helix-bundle protein [Clostridium sp. SHJSY1]|uniref:DUF2383 domain-containing protein n=1 Tax=Clostridium sp. SHJSY1 TaxID=2942483 RepID=UPI002875702F|nr:DUF2383 domain-containing protein [Clostridium sp. SHJSY1]MDS0525341.1 PA2169 family four-helix-bundle protein [Clostridium sp. SHJSY1]
MNDKEMVIHEMNKFLKGIHMGGTTFKDYLEKAKSFKLKEDLTQIIESFKRHEEAITKRINQLGGNASDTVGLMGMMGEFFEKVKLISANTDEEILEHAINAMEMGIKSGNKFIDEHKDLEESLLKEVKAIVDDYNGHIKKLREFI